MYLFLLYICIRKRCTIIIVAYLFIESPVKKYEKFINTLILQVLKFKNDSI